MAAAPIDVIGADLLHNVVSRLPATSFAYAACVNRSWNAICEHVLSRPKLSSACSLHPSLEIAVEEVVDKVLSQPIRPHFAILSVGGSHYSEDYEDAVWEDAHHLLTVALGSQVPLVINAPRGVIAGDAFSDEIQEVHCMGVEGTAVVMLIVGFIPGMKVATIPLSIQPEEPETLMTDEFVTDIREFSASVSGSQSPAAIVMFSGYGLRTKAIMEKLDYAMSPETVIVGEDYSMFHYTIDYGEDHPAAVALVFSVDRNKPPGIGKTRFYAVLSSRLSPMGPSYEATSVIEEYTKYCWIAARREGSLENLSGQTILNHVYDELGDRIQNRDLYIGVSSNRKCSIVQDTFGCMPSFAFYKVCGSYEKYFRVSEDGIKTNDTFRFYHPDSTAALSSGPVAFSHMRSFDSTTTSGDKQEVFGGLIFTSSGGLLSSQPKIDSSLFSDNFPGVTLGGTFCLNNIIGRCVLTTPYVKESQVRCCVHPYGAVYLVMSYTP